MAAYCIFMSLYCDIYVYTLGGIGHAKSKRNLSLLLLCFTAPIMFISQYRL